MRMKTLALSLAVILAPACVDDGSDVASETQAISDKDTRPHTLHFTADHGPDGDAHGGGGGGGHGGAPGNGINYHGGPIMTGTTGVYYIWYGNWTGNTAKNILTDLANSIGGSPYYNINTTYTDGSGNHVSNSVAYVTSVDDAYSRGSSSLSDGDIQTIVSTAITSGALPADPNAVYFVLTSEDVAKSGFCSSYCGWHTHATIAGTDIKYAFIGNAARCLSSCAAQTTSPNGNAGADAMASIISHELEEAATDPDLNAWYDKRGQENADKCAWTFGTTYSSGGGLANMHLGSRDYLIQRNWVNASGGYCSLSY